MQLTLEGRRALVTGGSRGLGLATARAFAEAGARVAIIARGQAALDAAAASIPASLPIRADIATAEGCDHAYRAAESALGGIDILVNNAGTSKRGPFTAVSDAEWQADLDLKLFAAIRLVRLAWPGMAERRFGRIINVLNIGAKAPPPTGAPTAVSRAAGLALTKVLAGEGAPLGINVNALLVGKIDSDQWVRRHAADPAGQSYEEWKEEAGRPIPMGRMGRPEEFAAMALALAAQPGDYVTGTAINVDGGMSPVP
ncbi:NAD(P)-dependent dehydrogenase, short-chain alcohol dehydrogenase family [Roseomonas rosea]|uniref:NAD(P)-dependent dehydrogenase, short-chain alcohol dehydrogenase family n=1 Tax=Muricoccus roseus TaxID=198092 RepID=A0A1M6RDJ8_9PROT|nr:SDR family oxidoreductase [Roseomonas rosea]SHK30522.1 NAD(P)-dependent dehydrogenase, short-chain alcohol dehydrogenase family [Roseomonas rosea]